MAIEKLRDRARGRWDGILTQLGIQKQFLNKKNGPCPMCGGKDRWRYRDTDGNGTWVCNHCRGGSGITLVMKYLAVDFATAATKIESVIGGSPTRISIPDRSEAKTRAGLNTLWRRAQPVGPDDATDRWLTGRGIRLDRFPADLRTGRAVRYTDGSSDATYFTAMLAMVRSAAGAPITIHRTYLTDTGQKAPVGSPRKLFSATQPGAAVRMAAHHDVLGVAEGIETALAASILFGVPTWATICANGMEKFEPPADINKLMIFGDNDTNHVGQRAAYALAARHGQKLDVEVHIPRHRRPGLERRASRQGVRMKDVAAKHAEIARRYRWKNGGGRRFSIASRRVSEIDLLIELRCGPVLPDDDDGLDYAQIVAHHLASGMDAPKRIRGWCIHRAPWMSSTEVEGLIRRVESNPIRWGADKLGKRLNLTDRERQELGITTIGSVDRTKAERLADRMARRRARDRLRKQHRRRRAGAKPREVYEAQSISSNKPWAAVGMSRATWYRMGRPSP